MFGGSSNTGWGTNNQQQPAQTGTAFGQPATGFGSGGGEFRIAYRASHLLMPDSYPLHQRLLEAEVLSARLPRSSRQTRCLVVTTLPHPHSVRVEYSSLS